jgi:hypothetical protein
MKRSGVMVGAVLGALVLAPAAEARTIRDGDVRFEVVTPSLIRIERAPYGAFEDRPTQTTVGRLARGARASTRVRGGVRVIRTSRLVLRWTRGDGPVGDGDLRVRTAGTGLEPALGPNPAPLGGWRRSLDHVDGPVPLHEGMLSRAGWYLLDDTETALLTGDGFAPRESPDGYQDLYLFAYGRRYARGLRDLRALTGAAPLLPRKALGVWFSRWWPYGDADWRALVERFRAEDVPLDVLSLDTDFKRVHDPAGAALASQVVGAPGGNYSWNAWDWNRTLYPDPAAFLRWAHEQGIDIGLNLHPSIDSRDPQFAATQERAGGGIVADPDCRVVQADTGGECMVFDWTRRSHLDAYFALHEPFERDGADFWWLDWCCDGTKAEAPGLTADTWINKQYFDRQRARGSRWPAFQRMGGSLQLGFGGSGGNGVFAEHRTTIQFTGDTCGTWPLIAFAAEFTASAASIGLPYVSHDTGSFFSQNPQGICSKEVSPYIAASQNSLPPEMYVRWVQLGTFQPFLRLHSHHGKRLPWDYDEPYRAIAARFLRLRESLVPYLYGLSRAAHDRGLPMARPLYLTWPGQDAAYEHGSQYTLGRDLLVAPVAEPGDPAQVQVWFPPGVWVDWFTGERHRGPALRTLAVPIDRLPVFARAGSILPTQPVAATTPAGPAPRVTLVAHAGNGRTVVYDDDGAGLAYERGAFSRTVVVQRQAGDGLRLRIGPASRPLPARRAWEIRLRGVARPRAVRVNGRAFTTWTHADGTLSLDLGARSTRRAVNVVVSS